MRLQFLVLSVLLAAGAASCAQSPASPAGAVSVVTPALASPANGAIIANTAQPVTLTVKNGFVASPDATVAYTFEVATDSGFANIVTSKDVPQGSGQTALKLDALAPGKDYFWHVRTKGDDTVGAFSSMLKFTIGPLITVAAPALAAPTNGATIANSAQPVTLTLTNAPVTPSDVAVTYTFEVATDNGFATIVQSKDAPQGSGQTSVKLDALAPGKDYFWHARTKGDDTVGTFSPAIKFTIGPAIALTAPTPVSPANGATIVSTAQPITLTVTNGTVTPAGPAVSYTFEVATDSAFANLVTSKDVAQTAGTTSLKLDALAPAKDYFWHARTKTSDTVGTFTVAVKFTIGPGITFSTPTAVSPATGSAADARPTFTITNVTHTGPVGPLSYRFDLATTPAFATVAISGTVAEGLGSTAFTPTADLSAETTYYWRAQAVDLATGAASGFSTAQNVFTSLTIDLTKVNYQRFVNISNWPVTDKIIAVEQDGGSGDICINHTMRNMWPTSNFEDNPLVPIEATQWYFARINGQWYGGAGEWLRQNQICKSGQKSEDIGKDGTWGGPMDTWIPKRGELVGYVISTPARAWPTWSTLDQRSNVVVQPWTVNGVSTP